MKTWCIVVLKKYLIIKTTYKISHLDKNINIVKLKYKVLRDLKKMELYQFEQQIKEPTRVTENTSTLIGLAFTNKAEIIVGVQVNHVGISDQV